MIPATLKLVKESRSKAAGQTQVAPFVFGLLNYLSGWIHEARLEVPTERHLPLNNGNNETEGGRYRATNIFTGTGESMHATMQTYPEIVDNHSNLYNLHLLNGFPIVSLRAGEHSEPQKEPKGNKDEQKNGFGFINRKLCTRLLSFRMREKQRAGEACTRTAQFSGEACQKGQLYDRNLSPEHRDFCLTQ
jgi:hypothetical protein